MAEKILTIGREFGSGGRTIGKLTAEKLGIDFYDKELVRRVAEKTGFNEAFIRQEGEYACSKSRLANAFSGRGFQGVMNGMSMEDYLWTIQYQVISALAEKGPCVIVGRCADFILLGRRDVFNIFIHASMEYRAERIVRLYGEKVQSPQKRLEERDKKRRLYYKHYTGREWGMAQNYHLSLDSSRFGIEKCVDAILSLVSPC